MSLDPSAILVILPEILLVVLAGVVLVLDLALKDEQRRLIGWVTAGGLLFVIIPLLFFFRPGDNPTLYWGGAIRVDWLSFVFKLLAFFGAAITAILAMDYEVIGKRGELYLLLIISTLVLGMLNARLNQRVAAGQNQFGQAQQLQNTAQNLVVRVAQAGQADAALRDLLARHDFKVNLNTNTPAKP